MSDNRNDLPSTNANNFEQRVRETIMTYMGRQGDPLDRGITLRDLMESGLVSLKDGAKLTTGRGTLPLMSGPLATAKTPADLTPPPTPTGFKVAAAISHVFIEHDDPLFVQGHGYLRTVLYGKVREHGADTPVFAQAVKLTEFSGMVGTIPSEPATTWHLWIKWQTNDGVLSIDPAGGTNGLVATTGQDVGKLLEVLNGQITSSQLYGDLSKRIDLIDGPDTMFGSVAARLRAEAEKVTKQLDSILDGVADEVRDRKQALVDEAKVRGDALIEEARLRGEDIRQVTQIIGDNDKSYSESIRTLTSSLGDATGAISTLESSLSTAQTTINTKIDTMVGEVKDPDTGVVATALASNVIQQRIDKDLSITDKFDTINNDFYDPVKGTVAKAVQQGVIFNKTDANTAISTAVKNLKAEFLDPDNGISSIAEYTDSVIAKSDPAGTALNAVKNLKAEFLDESQGISSIAEYTNSVVAKSDPAGTAANAITALKTEYENKDTGLVAKAINNFQIYSKTDTNGAITGEIKKVFAKYVDPATQSVSTAKMETDLFASTTAKNAIATEVKTLGAEFVDESGKMSTAKVGKAILTSADGKEAIAGELKNYTATNGKTLSQIAVEASTAASDTGNLKNQYTVKMESVGVDGKLVAAGFGLALEGATSQFLVKADRFAVVGTTRTAVGDVSIQETPFTVQTSDITDASGKVIVPKGVYIRDAFIKNGTITSAMITDATITSAKIKELDAIHLKAGDGTIGGDLKSTAFTETTGWKITPQGNATFNNATVRGTVYAGAGSIGGLTLAEGVIHSNGVTPSPKLIEPDLSRHRSVKQVVATGSGTPSTILVLKDGTVMAFGYWESGLFGANYTSASGLKAGEPMPITLLKNQDGTPFITDVMAADAGENFLAFLKRDGSVWFIGGSITGGMVPNLQKIAGVTDVVSISAAQNFLAMLTADGKVYVRGQQRDVICHNRETPNQNWDAPLNLVSIGTYTTVRASRVMKIIAGGNHLAMLDSTGYGWTAGNNAWGQLGVPVSNPMGPQLMPIHRAGPNTYASYRYLLSDIWAADRITIFAIKEEILENSGGLDVRLQVGGLYSVGCEMPFKNPTPMVYGDAWITTPQPDDYSTRSAPKLIYKSDDLSATYRVVIGGGIDGVPWDYRRAVIRQQGRYNFIFCLGFEGFERDLPVLNMQPLQDFRAPYPFTLPDGTTSIHMTDMRYGYPGMRLERTGTANEGYFLRADPGYSGVILDMPTATEIRYVDKGLYGIDEYHTQIGIPIYRPIQYDLVDAQSADIRGWDQYIGPLSLYHIDAPNEGNYVYAMAAPDVLGTWSGLYEQYFTSARDPRYVSNWRERLRSLRTGVGFTIARDDPNNPFAGVGFGLKASGAFMIGNYSGNRLLFDGSKLTYRGSLDVKSSTNTNESRMEISDRCIKVFEGGQLRVQIGDLS